MRTERRARAEIADMQGLPRKSGELVFHADWERRAFAIAVSLAEQGMFPWSDFQRRLIEAVAEAERDDPLHPSRGYYESWLAALERVLEDKGLASAAEAVRAVASASRA
ncbi:MAG TPA: nitrile hydratase accessory protein [Gammaproteobacteria bacterium]